MRADWVSTVVTGLLVALLMGVTGCSSNTPDEAASGTTPAGTSPAASTAPFVAPGAPIAAPGSAAPLPANPGAPVKAEVSKEEEKPPEPVVVDMEGLVAGLQSTNAPQVFASCEFFRQIPAAQRREVLAQLSASESVNVRGNTWRTFKTVATKDDIPTLITALQSPYPDVQIAAVEIMARFPNEQTIGVLTKLLESPEYRELGVGLLSGIGPACEAAVLPYATHADAGLRTSAWSLLAEVGTRKSVTLLDGLTSQAEYQKDETLHRALARLHKRLSGR